MEFLQAILYGASRAAFLVWPFLWEGSHEILKLGRSKNEYKKLKKSLSLWDKLSRRHHIRLSKTAIGYQKYFVTMIYLGYLCLFALLVLWIISFFTHNLEELLAPYFFVKNYCIELPASVFACCSQRRPRDKIGLVWVFVDQYDRQRYREKHKRLW